VLNSRWHWKTCLIKKAADKPGEECGDDSLLYKRLINLRTKAAAERPRTRRIKGLRHRVLCCLFCLVFFVGAFYYRPGSAARTPKQRGPVFFLCLGLYMVSVTALLLVGGERAAAGFGGSRSLPPPPVGAYAPWDPCSPPAGVFAHRSCY
jgi:hypothetical protein